MTLSGSSLATEPLSDNFAPLTVQRALMSHLLVLIACVFIHLVALSECVSTAEGALCRVLVFFLVRISVTIVFGGNYGLLLSESALALTSTHNTCVHRLCHLPNHIVAHLANHLVNVSKRLLEKWIVGEWITAKH